MPEIDLEWAEVCEAMADERYVMQIDMALSELNERCKAWQEHCNRYETNSPNTDGISPNFSISTTVLSEVLSRLELIV